MMHGAYRVKFFKSNLTLRNKNKTGNVRQAKYFWRVRVTSVPIKHNNELFSIVVQRDTSL
jgi:hypothetical protein